MNTQAPTRYEIYPNLFFSLIFILNRSGIYSHIPQTLILILKDVPANSTPMNHPFLQDRSLAENLTETLPNQSHLNKYEKSAWTNLTSRALLLARQNFPNSQYIFPKKFQITTYSNQSHRATKLDESLFKATEFLVVAFFMHHFP